MKNEKKYVNSGDKNKGENQTKSEEKKTKLCREGKNMPLALVKDTKQDACFLDSKIKKIGLIEKADDQLQKTITNPYLKAFKELSPKSKKIMSDFIEKG